MFGSNNDKPKLVGAREKRERAQEFSANYQVKSKKEGQDGGPLAPTILIWIICTALAFYLTEYVFKTSGLGVNTGSNFLDKIFFASGLITLTGSPDIDKIITIALRGTAIFAVTGTVPLAAYLWQKLIDRGHTNPYLVFWGVTAGMILVFYIMKDIAIPAVLEIMTFIFV